MYELPACERLRSKVLYPWLTARLCVNEKLSVDVTLSFLGRRDVSSYPCLTTCLFVKDNLSVEGALPTLCTGDDGGGSWWFGYGYRIQQSTRLYKSRIWTIFDVSTVLAHGMLQPARKLFCVCGELFQDITSCRLPIAFVPALHLIVMPAFLNRSPMTS